MASVKRPFSLGERVRRYGIQRRCRLHQPVTESLPGEMEWGYSSGANPYEGSSRTEKEPGEAYLRLR